MDWDASLQFSPGQVVVVIAGHVNGSDLVGKVVRKYGDYDYDEKHNAGKWLVDIEGILIPIEPTRLKNDDS